MQIVILTIDATNGFHKSVSLLANPSVLEGSALTDFRSFVANFFLKLNWGHRRTLPLDREDRPDAGFMRAIFQDECTFRRKSVGQNLMGLVRDHLHSWSEQLRRIP